MDVYFELAGQVFEWDEDKAKKNFNDHKVTFEFAAAVFMDSSAVQFSDDEHSDEELREILIGTSSNGEMLRVSFTERSPNVRIFSARPAARYDETRYDNGY